MSRVQPPCEVTAQQANKIAASLRSEGFSGASGRWVLWVARGYSLPDDPALESAILNALDELED